MNPTNALETARALLRSTSPEFAAILAGYLCGRLAFEDHRATWNAAYAQGFAEIPEDSSPPILP